MKKIKNKEYLEMIDKIMDYVRIHNLWKNKHIYQVIFSSQNE